MQLFLNKGEWKGKQLVSASYIEEATGTKVKTGIPCLFKRDTEMEYGYFIWRTSHMDAYFVYGWGGQLGLVLPDRDATVTITAMDFNNYALGEAVEKYLLPEIV